MTDKQLAAAYNLKRMIAKNEEILDRLARYSENPEFYMRDILDYFFSYPLFDPSLRQKLSGLLADEIAAGRKCVDREKEMLDRI